MLAFREDLEAIEARLCRVGITSVAELQAEILRGILRGTVEISYY